MKTEIKLWKQYCEQIEKYNKKEIDNAKKATTKIVKDHYARVDLMKKQYEKEYSEWEKKYNFYRNRLIAYDKLPYWKKIFIKIPEVPLRYSSSLYAPRDYSWSVGLPGMCLAFIKSPTYEGFLSWQVNKKI